MNFIPDTDNQETQEWLDSLSSVIDAEGTERAHFFNRNDDRSGSTIRLKLTL